MPDRPLNLIVLTSDEMRGDCPGYMGNPDCRTPSLDRFARRGVAFKRHFSVFPKCVPARIAAMTGRYCHTDGFRTIHQHLPNDQPDVLAALKAHGYESALFGINHCWENVYGDHLNQKGAGYLDYHSYTEGYFRHLLARKWPVPDPPEGAPEPMQTPEGYDFHYRGRKTEPRSGFCDDNRAEQAIHYLTEKWDTCMADCLLHVPCILWAPGLPQGQTVEGLTQHVDFPRALLELLGLDPDWGIHGRNLLAILSGQQQRVAAFADGGHEEEMWARMPAGEHRSGKQKTYAECPETMARAKMVRTERWKLVTRLVGGNELYDMENDPHEMRNLWSQVEEELELGSVVLDLQQKLIDWCTRTDTDRPYQERVGA